MIDLNHQFPASGAKRVLVVAPDALPLPGLATTGAGQRAWGLAQGLRSRGHEVLLAMPRSTATASGYDGRGEAHVFDDHALPAFVEQLSPDVVVCQHWPWANALGESHPRLVIDLHGPLLLETLFHSGARSAALVGEKLRALSRAEFFTCAGTRQRNYFFGWLQMAGFDLRTLPIEVVPFAHSPQVPSHQYPEDAQFVFGGVFLPWQDPSLGLRVLAGELERATRGAVWLFGGKHPRMDLPPGKIRETLAELARSPRCQLHGMVSHDVLVEHYTRASVAWDVMAHNCEREMAITSRTIEYLWAGLPVVHQRFAELAGAIGEYEAGWLVDPEDETELRRVVREILSNPCEIARRGANAQRLIRERYNWPDAITPLDAWIRAPRAAARFSERPLLGETAASASVRRVWQQMKRTVKRNRWTDYVARQGWRAGQNAWRRWAGAASKTAA